MVQTRGPESPGILKQNLPCAGRGETIVTTSPMSAGDMTPFIRRMHKQCKPGQMFREVPVNSAQAGATLLQVDTFWPAVESLGVHYRTFEDDGVGMSPAEIPRFLNAFGGSGKTIGIDDDNFGIGFKVSTLPDNRYGIVILTLKDGFTSMMWLWTDPSTDKIGARHLVSSETFESEDFDEIVAMSGTPSVIVLGTPEQPRVFEALPIDGIDWADPLPQWIKDAGHGTCFIMLGNERFAHGDESSKYDTLGETKYGVPTELSKRFWHLPLPVKVRNYANFGDRALWPTERPVGGGTWRSSVGLAEYLQDASRVSASGEVEVEARGLKATVSWFIFDRRDDGDPRQKQGPQRGDRISEPFIGARFESHPGVVEVMDLLTAQYAESRLTNWVGPREIARRIGIIVTPNPDAEVWQDGTRTMLRYNREGIAAELPWSEWANVFVDLHPEEIKVLLAEHYASKRGDLTMGLSDDDYKRLGSRFSEWLLRHATAMKKINTKGKEKSPLTEDPDGTETVLSDGGSGERHGGRGTATPARLRRTNPTPVRAAADGEQAPASDSKSYSTLPRADFGEVGDPCYAMEYMQGGHCVSVNENHFYWQSFQAALIDAYRDQGEEFRASLVEAARPVWLSSASLAVAHQLALAKKYPEHHDVLMSPVALTAALAGIRNHLEVASGPVGKHLGIQKKKRAAESKAA